MNQTRSTNHQILTLISLFFLIYISCVESHSQITDGRERLSDKECATAIRSESEIGSESIVCGADRIAKYRPLLMGKRVGLVVNQTSQVGGKHILDSLLELEVNVTAAFAPEHGFRGEADDGAKIENGKDSKTGIPIISIYGKKKAPSEEELAQLDVVVFDIQDVGCRFYTFISTMHYVMEACAKANVPVIVLDRPNPNGHYVDGPILEKKYKSFVGMHPIPVVHGLTVGELAKMINGEGWLGENLKCDLTVIECLNYDHQDTYALPVRPSPNLPNLRSIYLYPSLCFFEATKVSIGRGTEVQFQVMGHPDYTQGTFAFTPEPKFGAQSPKLNGELCQGLDLTNMDPAQIKDWGQLNLSYLKDFLATLGDDMIDRPEYFDKLAGTDQLRKDLLAGLDEEAIRAKWADGLKKYRAIRGRYLLYGE